jgi:hypothetical protein
MEQKVIWKYETDDIKVKFEFDAYQLSSGEVFEKWVRFMNAVGFVLDPEEMDKMWNDEY